MVRVKISGNTYPVKDALKVLGGRWDAAEKAWMVPAEKADEARALVAGAPPKAKSGARQRSGKCADCGKRCGNYYRCYDCSLEYRPGGGRHMGGQSYHYTDSNGRRQFVLGDDD